jgi:hypothetical protein
MENAHDIADLVAAARARVRALEDVLAQIDAALAQRRRKHPTRAAAAPRLPQKPLRKIMEDLPADGVWRNVEDLVEVCTAAGWVTLAGHQSARVIIRREANRLAERGLWRHMTQVDERTGRSCQVWARGAIPQVSRTAPTPSVRGARPPTGPSRAKPSASAPTATHRVQQASPEVAAYLAAGGKVTVLPGAGSDELRALGRPVSG